MHPAGAASFFGMRAMSSSAPKTDEAPAAGVALYPLHRKGDNLFDLLALLDYYGVGYKAARKDWVARYVCVCAL